MYDPSNRVSFHTARKSMMIMALSVLVVGMIGLTFIITNPIQLAQALNPQPLPPGIIQLKFPRILEPPDPCAHTSACRLPSAILHFTPPDPCIRVALCKLLPGLEEHFPHRTT